MNPNVQGSIPTSGGFFGLYEWLFFDNNKLILFLKIIYYGQFIALSKKISETTFLPTLQTIYFIPKGHFIQYNMINSHVFCRSHPFAFSLDGGCQCLILSGNSETESQLWMRQIRDLLWPRVPTIWLRTGRSFCICWQNGIRDMHVVQMWAY